MLLAKESKSDKNNLWLVFVRTRHDLVDIAVFQFAKNPTKHDDASLRTTHKRMKTKHKQVHELVV